MSALEILWPVLALTFAMVGIHTLFGLEILRRGVIFTDLAVGQVAAVGIAVSSAFLGGEHQAILSLVFSFAAALLIAYVSRHSRHIEAFIGLLYAMGASAVMIVLSQGSEGDELFKRLMANDILFVGSGDILQAVGVYGVICLLYWGLYSRLSGFVRELFFFSLLSLMVTTSVPLAGVLVVFTLLIAPAYVALLQKRFIPVYFGWMYGWGFIASALYLSYRNDWPTGYSIVFVGTFVTLPIVLWLERAREVKKR
ncbi:MAG: metal ABC transporter permease [Sulfuricurvum sp.]|uniref:metal ABC transporter permease n=1 Tax=Sulfuricurvum sp. TaxID=2025608 RepID=UPI003D14FC13